METGLAFCTRILETGSAKPLIRQLGAQRIGRNFVDGRTGTCRHAVPPWVVQVTGQPFSAHDAKLRRNPILPFYDFRALMRSATSR